MRTLLPLLPGLALLIACPTPGTNNTTSGNHSSSGGAPDGGTSTSSSSGGSGSSSSSGSAGPLGVQGTVRYLVEQGQPSAAAGALTMQLGVDLNNSGAITPNEQATAQTADDGTYTLSYQLDTPATVVLSVKTIGYAPAYRTVAAQPGINARVDLPLAIMSTLSCAERACQLDDRSLHISNLPDGVGGSGRVFSPQANALSWPGALQDEDGNILTPWVFAHLSLSDSQGSLRPIITGAPIRMRLPRSSWPIITDLMPGNDRIEVPVLIFDDAKGTWKREGTGHLVDGDGMPIAENAMGAIQDGSHTTDVQVSTTIRTFNYVAAAAVHEETACLSGTLQDSDGNAAAGAIVTARSTHTLATLQPVVADAAGQFCVPARVGSALEPRQVVVRAFFNGTTHDVGTHSTPTSAAACGGACGDVGTVQLTQGNALLPVACTFTGTVVDRAGAPVENARVHAWDLELSAAEREPVCGMDNANCDAEVHTDATGSFTLRGVVREGALIEVFRSVYIAEGHTGTREGRVMISGCPSTPATVELNEGRDRYDVTLMVGGTMISWVPSELGANSIIVSNSEFQPKWVVNAGTSRIASPVIYGIAPMGATVIFPANGGLPQALASGDTVQVTFNGTTSEGYPFGALATVTVP